MKPAKQLAVAAAEGDLEGMRALLAADPALARDWQPLMDACFAGQVAAVELLLDHGADPNVVSKSNFRYRPLHRTMERKVSAPRDERHVAVVQLLLDRGADPLARATTAQVNAVAMAAMQGEARFLSLLVPRMREPDVFTAAVLGDAARVEALLAADPSLATATDENGWNALRYCCQSRADEADPAAAAGLARLVRLLLERGAALDGCVDVLVYRNKPELSRLLLERGATIADGDTLNHAACDGAHAALAVLLEFGVDLNKTEGTEHHGGYVPFGCTLTCRSVRGAQWFLDHGVDPNFVGSKTGENSLHVAVRSGAGPQLLQLLADRGADLNARDDAGHTPLAAACAKNHATAIQFLTALGAEG